MGNSCLTDPNGVITMKVMDFYDLIDVVSKKSAQETVKILPPAPSMLKVLLWAGQKLRLYVETRRAMKAAHRALKTKQHQARICWKENPTCRNELDNAQR